MTFLHEHEQPGVAASLLGRLDPRVMLVCSLALVLVIVSTPLRAAWALGAYGALLLLALLASRVPPRIVLHRWSHLLLFILLLAAFLPFHPAEAGGISYHLGALKFSQTGLERFAGVVLRSGLSALALVLLSSIVSLPRQLAAMEQLRVPGLITMLLGFTFRYFEVLRDEARRMQRARDARCWRGRWLWQARTIGEMVGTLYLRSYERADRIYCAMLARGYQGRSVGIRAQRLLLRDWLFLLTLLAATLGIRAAAG